MSMPDKPQGSGGSNTLMIVLIVLLVLGLLCAGVCGGCVFFGARAVNEAGKAATQFVEFLNLKTNALSAVVLNDMVRAKLGDGIEEVVPSPPPTLPPPGAVESTFTFTVKGSQAAGEVIANAQKESDTWRLVKVTVRCDDGTEIDVPVDNEGGGTQLNFDLDLPASK